MKRGGFRFPATGWDSIVRVYAEAQCTVTPNGGQKSGSQIILKQITYRELLLPLFDTIK